MRHEGAARGRGGGGSSALAAAGSRAGAHIDDGGFGVARPRRGVREGGFVPIRRLSIAGGTLPRERGPDPRRRGLFGKRLLWMRFITHMAIFRKSTDWGSEVPHQSD